VTRPPFPPYPPYPPFPQHVSPPPYPPYPPYPPTLIEGTGPGPSGFSPGAPSPAPSSTSTGAVRPIVDPGPGPQPPGPQPPGPPPDTLSIFFNYGRYDVVDATAEGLGQGQFGKLSKFVGEATAAKATGITVNGFASPENNLPPYQLPLNRATAVKNKLDQLFDFTPTRPTITVKTTAVLAGDPSTYPSLRRADVSVTSQATT
jgi:hypothetical protein